MKRHLTALALAVSQAMPIAAEPFGGRSIGPDGDLLQFSCLPSNSGVRCEFIQVLMMVAANDDDLIEELANLEELAEEFAGDSGFLDEFCPQVPDIMRIFNLISEGRRNDAEELASQMGSNNGGLFDFDGVASADPREWSDARNQMQALGQLCQGVTLERLEAFVRLSHEQRARTCRPFINTWEAEFTQVSDEVWSIAGENAFGPCGVVRLDRFVCDGELGTLCTFISEKRVLNPDGQILGGIGSCSELEETQFVYDWRAGPQYLPCNRIDF